MRMKVGEWYNYILFDFFILKIFFYFSGFSCFRLRIVFVCFWRGKNFYVNIWYYNVNFFESVNMFEGINVLSENFILCGLFAIDWKYWFIVYGNDSFIIFVFLMVFFFGNG